MNRKIVFLLFPGVHLMDLAGPAQVFYEASQLGGQSYKLIYAAATDQVLMQQTLQLCRLSPLKDLNPSQGDLVCIPGIDFEKFKEGKIDDIITEVKPWVFAQAKKGVYIGSICSGALVLATMEFLNQITCTTHWKCLKYMSTRFPQARVQTNRLYCFDRNIFTSAGMTSGIDMALALVERWDSPLVAARVAQEMVINIRRADSVEQRNIFLDFKNHFNADVYKAQEILASNLQSNFTLADLAKHLHLSPRHLSRLFKSHTGITPQDYRDNVRLKLGVQLLSHTEKSIKEIAIECGFDNARQFLRLWKKNKGSTPSAFRESMSVEMKSAD